VILLKCSLVFVLIIDICCECWNGLNRVYRTSISQLHTNLARAISLRSALKSGKLEYFRDCVRRYKLTMAVCFITFSSYSRATNKTNGGLFVTRMGGAAAIQHPSVRQRTYWTRLVMTTQSCRCLKSWVANPPMRSAGTSRQRCNWCVVCSAKRNVVLFFLYV
jgi:hypothetical protein